MDSGACPDSKGTGHAPARADATKCGDDFRRPVERHRHPRTGDALVTSLKEKPDLFDVASAAAVMPKGRNFH